MLIFLKKNSSDNFQIQPLLIIATILLIFIPLSSKAQSNTEGPCPKYPCQKIVEITAYYSPLPFQEKYLTHDYEKEIKLNGRGTNGADGTQVYPGLIAAPRTYQFGTKIFIPGFGNTTVHDRGGAILSADPNLNRPYDHLDIWTGYGDSGLKRALKWGRRIKEITIYDSQSELQDEVHFDNLEYETERPQTALSSKKIVVKYQYFPEDLGFGIQNEKVQLLQNYLLEFGILKNAAPGIYDQPTLEAIREFQLRHQIIPNSNHYAAGYFGPQTRLKFEEIIDKTKQNEWSFLNQNIGKNTQGDHVKKLQEHLIRLQLLPAQKLTSTYDAATINAVYQFQLQKQIVKSESSAGAGYFGPQTRSQFQKTLLSSIVLPPISKKAQPITTQTPSDTEYFSQTLKFGDQGEEVHRLQNKLKSFGLFSTTITGFYGEITAHAVFKFQQSQKIVQSKTDPGAGTLGNITIQKLNSLIKVQQENEILLAAKNISRDLTDEKSLIALNEKSLIALK